MRRILLAIALGTLPPPSAANVIRVPDDQPSIAAAMAVAVPGDTVIVACGIYHESGIWLVEAVTLQSETGTPDCVTVEGDDKSVIFYSYYSAAPVSLIGLTLRGASFAIRAGDGNLHVSDCLIADNQIGIDTDHATLNLTRCELRGNTAWVISHEWGGHLVMDDCLVHHNPGSILLRLYYAGGAGHWIRRVVFWANNGSLHTINSARLDVADCVFYANSGPLSFSTHDVVDHSVLVANGGAIGCPEFSCCDLFQNAQGDWTGCRADQLGADGNISADPLFCDPEDGDFALREDSPCLPRYTSCPRPIGGHVIGCGVISVAPESWGVLKERYRSRSGDR